MPHNDKDLNCRGWLVGESPNAICVAKEPGAKGTWIPRSLVGYMKKSTETKGTAIVFTCPDWAVEQKQLWDLVD